MIDISKIDKTENALDPASLVAQLRIKQGLGYEYKPQQGQMIGNVYVGASPMQHLAEALRGGMAGYEEAKGMQDLVDIQAKKQASAQRDMSQYVNLLRGTPDVPEKAPAPDLEGNAVGPTMPAQQGMAPNPQAAEAYALASSNPMLKQLALNRIEKEPEIQARADQKEQDRQFRKDMLQQQIEAKTELARLVQSNRQQKPGGDQWKYDSGSDTWVQPPNEQFPIGRATPNVGKVAAGQNFDYLANNFVGDEKNPGIVDKTPQGGWLGIGGKLGTGTQSAKEFDNAKEQMSTELRKIFRIPGEGALSDKEQAQYGIQLPSRDNDPDLNRQIVKDLRFRVANSVNPQGVNPLQPNAPKPEGRNPKPVGPKVGDAQDGFVFMGGNPADPKSWKKQ